MSDTVADHQTRAAAEPDCDGVSEPATHPQQPGAVPHP